MVKKYIYDLKTKNISFLQTARDLKNVNIKNNMFFLKLYDRSLQGVDPYSPLLTENQVMRIINECIINPWYFLREIAKIPEQGGPGIQYLLNRGNLAATWCFLHGIDHYLVIPRQIGKTQSTIAILLWAFLFGTSSSEFMFLNKNQDDANKNLGRLKAQRELLPKYLQFNLSYTEEGKLEKGIDNTKSITNVENKNSIVTKPSASSIESAERVGRGSTQPIQFSDEVEFTPFIKTIMEAAGPTFKTASETAQRNNAAYCRIFTSTPGDLDTQPGKDAQLIIEKTTKWNEDFYNWKIDETKDYIKTNAENGIVYIEYQYTELGKDEEWFRETCRLLNNEKLKIKREIFLQRLHGSSDSPFDPTELAAINDYKGKIKEEIFINKLFKLDVYEELKKDMVYIVGVDVSAGYGEDNCATTILNPYTLKPVAEFKSPFIGTTNYTKFLYVLIRKHIPKGILCIERNSYGENILDALRQTEIRGQLYYDKAKDMIGNNIDDKLDEMGMLKLEAARRRYYGVYTEGKSREVMMDLLDTHVKEHKDLFVTENIISDIFKLVKDKRGKIVAGKGFHDDCIMSYLIALYVYYHGNNLHRFGYSRGDKLVSEEERNKGLTYEELINELPEEVKEMFSDFSVKTNEDYNNKIIDEIKKARRESDYLNDRLNPVDVVRSGDEDYDEEMSLDIFDELNS